MTASDTQSLRSVVAAMRAEATDDMPLQHRGVPTVWSDIRQWADKIEAALTPSRADTAGCCDQCRRNAALLRNGSPFVMEPLPDRDDTKDASEQGLFRKFDVRRTDGSDAPGGKHHGCEYFVLDVKHDPHVWAALAAYANAAEVTHPDLSADMRERYGLPAPAGDARGAADALRALATVQRYAFPIIHIENGPDMVTRGCERCDSGRWMQFCDVEAALRAAAPTPTTSGSQAGEVVGDQAWLDYVVGAILGGLADGDSLHQSVQDAMRKHPPLTTPTPADSGVRLPGGWYARRHGDELMVGGPPGGVTLNGKGSLTNRILFGLADALAAKPEGA